MQTGNLNNDFQECLSVLMEHGMESHPRGTTTKELLNYNITVSNPRNRVISFRDRHTNLKYLLGEFFWYLGGSNYPDGILNYSKFWANITNSGANEDYPEGTINSNYGHRLFGNFKLIDGSQWENTKAILKQDKDSRQAVQNIHLPPDRHHGNKDVPCTLTLQWFIRENALHLIVNMRSNDVILGFTNDVFQFTMLQEAMMLELRDEYPDLQLGHYFHNAGSMHIYDRHFEMAEKIISDRQVMEFSMKPMDRFDQQVVTNMILVEMSWQNWVKEGSGEPYDFDANTSFNLLTPYWQNLVKAFFGDDDKALHEVFEHA